MLGDTHNFGRRVTSRGEWIHKPRSVSWEWLMLSPESPLRVVLDELAPPGTFAFLPRLRFRGWRTGRQGEVERLSLSPLSLKSAAERRALAAIVGRSLALWSWLGVSDLHWENLALGRDERGNVVFGPLDLELVLADLSLPTQTKLIPDADPEVAAICRHAAGVRRVLPYLGKPITVSDLMIVLESYRNTLELLGRHSRVIAEAIARLPRLAETPIRVMLRGTDEYVRARTHPVWPPLLEAETEQMERGDIPYFFRLLGKPAIRYWGDRALRTMKRIPLRGDVPGLDPMLSVAKGLHAASRAKLLELGSLVVLGAFDHPSFTGTHEHGPLRVTFGARTLTMKLPSGDERRCARDLRSVVGSVYLPCSCGEVRSVMVPSVTACVHAQKTRDTATRRGVV